MHPQRTPVSLAPIDAVAVDLAQRPTLAMLLGRELPAWLDDLDLWDRVWSRVIGDLITHCWVWTASRDGKGRNEMKANGTQTGPYRVIYEWLVGPIPPRLVLDHLCMNRLCVNPSHLEAVTAEINVARGRSFSAINARKNRCPQGHPYDETNTIRLPDGGRRCRVCRDGYYMEHREQMRLRRNAAYAARAVSLGRNVLPQPGDRTHCKRGHEYTPENTYVTIKGHRQCRECNRILDRKRYPARAEEVKRRARESKARRKGIQ